MGEPVPSEQEIINQGNALVAEIARKLPQAGFLRDSQSQILQPIRPVLRDSADDVWAAWGRAAALAIDFIHNSGWLAGGVEQASVDTIGDGLILNVQPYAKALGWDDDQRAEWCNLVEQRWQLWSENPYECDLRGLATIGDMTDAMVRWHYGYGEGVAVLVNRRRAQCESRLKVQMVQPHRMPLETDETRRLRQGVFLNGDGLPVGYRFRQRGRFGEDVFKDVAARNRAGQRQVLHVFSGDPTQLRGMTPLAPVLKVTRQYDQMADATLTAALLQTVLAATITSDAFSDEILGTLNDGDGEEGESLGEAAAFMAAKLDWASRTKIDLGQHGKVVNLFPGEKLELTGAKTPNDNYQNFTQNLLREIARCMGISYEALTLDHSNATYSSVRMGVSTIWPVTLRRRRSIAVPFVRGVFERWLDEEIITGRVGFPGGWENYKKLRAFATRSRWQGPARPTADDFKTAKAQSERLSNGTSSLTQECAENGTDFETIAQQRKYEQKWFEDNEMASPYCRTQQPDGAAGVTDEDLEREGK